MNRSQIRRLLLPDADEVLAALSTRQFINPHKPAGKAIIETAESLGICSSAAARAVTWLEVNAGTAVGRLRRTELAQMARCLVRFARHQAQTETTDADPATAAV